MKTKKISNIVFIACFLCFLFVAMAATLLREKETYSYFENRNLATMPELTKENVISGSYFTGAETYLEDHAAGRSTLLKADTFIQLKLLKRPVVNDVVVQDDILLPYNEFTAVDETQINAKAQKMAENLVGINEVVEENGGTFYYVAVPCQNAYFYDEYPWYLNSGIDTINASMTAIKSALSETNVRLIDVGEYFDELGHPTEFGSLIDNHYTMQGAYTAYEYIMDTINSDLGLDLTVLREGDFEYEALPNRYVGSRSRKILEMWDNNEKLYILNPNVEVPFTRTDNGNANRSFLYKTSDNEYDWLTYVMYMAGDIAETIIDTDRDELPSVLIYGDSFTNAVETVLYYGFDEMHSLDLRYYHDKTLREYIEDYKPEIVICLRNYAAIIDTTDNGLGPDGK
jgi:hypothetical protein